MNRYDLVRAVVACEAAAKEFRVCSVVNCDSPIARKDMCSRHYQRVKAYGSIHPLTPRLSPERYFWSFVLVPASIDDCWIWTGPKNLGAYGHATFIGKRTSDGSGLAHRLTYELYRGPVPLGLVLDHLCRVTVCVNPGHLEAVTQRENTRRGQHGVLRVHCPYGHEMVPSNTYTRPGTERRQCRACKRRDGRLYMRRKRTAVAA